MIRFQTAKGGHASSRGCVIVGVICLVLLALLTFVQVAHVHQVDSDADHCPLCIVLHAAVPVTVAAAVIVLIQLGASAPVFEVVRAGRPWHPTLFTRPPPVRL